MTSLLLLLACGEGSLNAMQEESLPPAELAFEDAAARTEVPMELLLAIARVETGVQSVEGAVEFPGQEPAFGVMGLRGENLVRAARLAGLDEALVRTDVSANSLAAATLLSEWGAEAGIDPSDLSAWAPIVARYSGIEDPEAAAEYVWYEVYAALQDGVDAGGYSSDPQMATPKFRKPSQSRARTGASDAVWTASPNYSSRSGASVDYVIIHTCEGSYSGCWGWLTNSSAGVSAHYVVNDSGSEVRQLVDEDSKAWHISASYDCANNSNKDCSLNGKNMNSMSVGIEHAGYGSQTSWSSGLLDRSAKLTCGITDRHGISRDAYHIVGHGQLQPWNRSDPGAAWPWSSYLSAVNTACGAGSGTGSGGTGSGGTGSGSGGSGTGSGGSGSGGSGSGSGGSGSGSGGTGSSAPTASSFIIDSNNAANDTNWFLTEVSADWWSSSSSSGYYNTGYWVAATEATSDPASFWFLTEAAGCYTVDAWWTAGSNRSAAISFMGWDEADREVGRTTVSQQINGGKWNELGDWTFPAGWNRVLLSRWTTPGSYAIADAVRLTPCN